MLEALKTKGCSVCKILKYFKYFKAAYSAGLAAAPNAKMENGKGAQIGTEAGQDTRKGALTHHAQARRKC